MTTLIRVVGAFLYGILLGVLWECASMAVLVGATIVEHLCGTAVMALLFVGLAAFAYSVASRADLGRPLLSILAFRMTAQFAMTLGTGSILLSTMLHNTPACSSEQLRRSGWRRPLLRLVRRALPRRWLRRIFGVEPPYGPPFVRVLTAVLSRDWLGWVPSLGMPSLLSLPGTITFKSAGSSGLPAGGWSTPAPADYPGGFRASGQEMAGVYTYACRDATHDDFYYLFRYHAFWMRPAAMALLHAMGSLFIRMMLMHAYAALFMLLAQAQRPPRTRHAQPASPHAFC